MSAKTGAQVCARLYMKILTFIRQRSFARYIMVDLTSAARGLGCPVRWLDLEGTLHANAAVSDGTKAQVIADTIVGIERFNPDLVFSYGLEYLEPMFADYLEGVDESFQDMLRRPAVYFLCDFGHPFDADPSDVPARYLAPLQHFDSLVLCWDRVATSALHAAGVTRAIHWPLAVSADIFHDRRSAADDPGEPNPIVFLGGPTEQRIQMLEPLSNLGLVIYGYDSEGWHTSPALARCYAGELLDRDRGRAAYQRAKISVNVTRPHGRSSLNMRVFEAMACGSLVLTDDRSDASTYFTDGRDLVIYRNAEDLRDKARYYLTHERERQAIAQAGMRKVRAQHTYDARLQSVRPTLHRFLRESRGLRRMREFVGQDPAKALRFGHYLEQEQVVRADHEDLALLKVNAFLALREHGRARNLLGAIREASPRHLAAMATDQRISPAA